jgi:hypothetical protein
MGRNTPKPRSRFGDRSSDSTRDVNARTRPPSVFVSRLRSGLLGDAGRESRAWGSFDTCAAAFRPRELR